jgi:glutamate carboxypeptidase
MHPVQKYLQDHLSSYLELLRQMVAINSFTSNAEGVNRLAEFTTEAFSSLGFEAEFIQSPNSNYGKHLFLTRKAATLKPSSKSRRDEYKTIALISHLDTVFSPEEERINNFSWHRVDDRIYGPGTVDIKGGTVMIYMVMDALNNMAPQAYDSITWLIALDATEEVLSDDFGRLILERLPDENLACLVFEGSTHAKGAFPLVIARKGRATFQVRVQGRSAHAGNNHAQGANAILQIAHTIQQIAAFTDYEKQITFNVGTIKGGSVVNRVPHYAEAEVEMRAFSPIIFKEGYERILGLAGSSQVFSEDGYACQVSIQPVDQASPWPLNPGTEKLYNHWLKTAETLDLCVQREERGGLSDGNPLWDHFPTLDGLGPVGANAHCSERSTDGNKVPEYVRVSSFVPKALLNTIAILSLINPDEAASLYRG